MIDQLAPIALALASCAFIGWHAWHGLRILSIRSIEARRAVMIDQLRQGGVAASICFHQSNDDPDSVDDQEAITVNADWTNWQDRQYRAASIDIALAQAVNDMERAA